MRDPTSIRGLLSDLTEALQSEGKRGWCQAVLDALSTHLKSYEGVVVADKKVEAVYVDGEDHPCYGATDPWRFGWEYRWAHLDTGKKFWGDDGSKKMFAAYRAFEKKVEKEVKTVVVAALKAQNRAPKEVETESNDRGGWIAFSTKPQDDSYWWSI